MEALIEFLSKTIANQALLQVFVGGATFLLIGYMVVRARQDKENMPAPAAGGLGDVPQPFLQGPREVVDMMRETRDYLRRISEDTPRIVECTRIIREENKKQTEILDRMAEDQRVEARVAAERRHP